MHPRDPSPSAGDPRPTFTRREAIRQTALLGAAVFMTARASAATTAEPEMTSETLTHPEPPATAAAPPARSLHLHFQLNGQPVEAEADARTSLLDLVRETLDLTGTKKGCDHGQCGACTVLIDGRRVLSCLTLAATVEGKHVQTIEGLAQGDTLHPVQAAFLEHDGLQCGFCTPGQIVSAVGFLHEPWPEGEDAIREGMSGNLCRCGAYRGIVAAIEQARKTQSAHA